MSGNLQNKHVLDTSAINELFDDPEKTRLVDGMKELTILPTALSVVELCATEDPSRRTGLMKLLKEIGGDMRPLAIPNQLIMRACRSFAKQEGLMMNDGEEEGIAFSLLHHPEKFDEEMQRAALADVEQRDAFWRKLYEGAREDFNRAFAVGASRPRSIRELMDIYNKNEDLLYTVINSVFERAVGQPLRREHIRPILEIIPHIRIFFMAYAAAAFQRAMRMHSYGHRKNPGQFDLWSSAYLPSTHTFVTHDTRQRRVLKILGRNAGLDTRVISYKSFRTEIHVPEGA